MASGFRLGVGQMFSTSCFYRVRRCWNLLTSKCAQTYSNSNQLSWLSGVPGSVRTLSVASNL